MGTPFYQQHLSLPQLRSQLERRNNDYLFIDVPAYPRPELRVAHVSHSTTLGGLRGILGDCGFRSPRYRPEQVVWFSLTVSRAELSEAEGRSLTVVHPDGTEEEVHRVPSAGPQRTPQSQGDVLEAGRREGRVLQTFASSPAFMSSSRLGSFCFTLPLQDVLDKYSQQFCGGQEPVMRVWKTVLFKQKVKYAVLVHSPANEATFCELPLLKEEPKSICAFREEPRPHFIWRPQAMSETHSFELQVDRENNSLTAEFCPTHDEFGRRVRLSYYVWDEVDLALDVGHKVLRFEDAELRDALRFCEMGVPPRPSSNFQTFEEAQSEVPWPLQHFSESEFAINP